MTVDIGWVAAAFFGGVIVGFALTIWLDNWHG
jgi:hypothetical protein